MQKKSPKILHLSRETLQDLASQVTGGAITMTCPSQSVCPRNKVCD